MPITRSRSIFYNNVLCFLFSNSYLCCFWIRWREMMATSSLSHQRTPSPSEEVWLPPSPEVCSLFLNVFLVPLWIWLEIPSWSLLTWNDQCHSCVSPAQDLLVYLVSDSAVHLTLEGLGCMNAQELGRNVREALNIPNSAVDVFAFWFCSPLLGN